MSSRRIEIERLEIRLKSVSPASARAAMDGLGRELAGTLAAATSMARHERIGRIGAIDSGAVRLAAGASPSELRTAIARRVAASITTTPT